MARIDNLRIKLAELEAAEASAKADHTKALAALAAHRKTLDKAILDAVVPTLGSMDKGELDASIIGLDKRSARAVTHIKEVIG